MKAETSPKELSTGEKLLETKDLTKSFGGLTAVDGVDYQIQKGDIQCLIGPNGAGKSTFFGMLTGQLSPTDGRILYKGDDITDLLPHERARRGISLKFQTLNIYEELTVSENLRLPCQRVDGETQLQIEELADQVNLIDQLDDPVDNLSHGEQQWLEIGMSIGIEPELLLLDEPTAGMTVEETEQTGNLIKSLVESREMTILVVEHDMKFVRQISEQVTVLHHGGVFRQGTIDEIASDPEVKRIYLGEGYDSDE
jgi:branched-chain amino acid transport system ATP-binding protein